MYPRAAEPSDCPKQVNAFVALHAKLAAEEQPRPLGRRPTAASAERGEMCRSNPGDEELRIALRISRALHPLVLSVASAHVRLSAPRTFTISPTVCK